jgi:hypothetical protein
MTGLDLPTVNYRGSGPAISDLIGGQVQVMFDLTVSSVEQIRAGRLRPLGVTTATRIEALPDVPLIGRFCAGYEWPASSRSDPVTHHQNIPKQARIQRGSSRKR